MWGGRGPGRRWGGGGRHCNAATPRVLVPPRRQFLQRGHGSYIGNNRQQTKVAGLDEISRQILKFLAGSLATSGQKKRCTEPKFHADTRIPNSNPCSPSCQNRVPTIPWWRLYLLRHGVNKEMPVSVDYLPPWYYAEAGVSF